jgi:phosphoribosyl 1,2-cyclic phosphodiesterase
MNITVLASGSGGNSTYIETKNSKILIDCGISYKQMINRLSNQDLSLEHLDAILITHEHSDHIKGVDVTLKKHKASLYVTKNTYDGFYFKVKENIKIEQLSFITPYEEFYINDLKILPISISHDSNDCVGYIIEEEGKKLVYVTDVGYLPVQDHQYLSDADMYIFESNYDVTALFTSRRPFYLKQRIDSVKGHMSNSDSAYNLAQLVGPKTKKIILAHRSKECNTDELALNTYKDVFQDYDLDVFLYEIEVAKQDTPTKLYIL